MSCSGAEGLALRDACDEFVDPDDRGIDSRQDIETVSRFRVEGIPTISSGYAWRPCLLTSIVEETPARRLSQQQVHGFASIENLKIDEVVRSLAFY